MSEDRIEYRNMRHLRLETVAEVYEVRREWLFEAYELGLLGEGAVIDSAICIAVTELERVARIVRLRNVLGGNLQQISLELDRT